MKTLCANVGFRLRRPGASHIENGNTTRGGHKYIYEGYSPSYAVMNPHSSTRKAGVNTNMPLLLSFDTPEHNSRRDAQHQYADSGSCAVELLQEG